MFDIVVSCSKLHLGVIAKHIHQWLVPFVFIIQHSLLLLIIIVIDGMQAQIPPFIFIQDLLVDGNGNVLFHFHFFVQIAANLIYSALAQRTLWEISQITVLISVISVVFVANLEPRKMRFGVSEGMVLAAGPGGEDIFLATPDAGAKSGMRVK